MEIEMFKIENKEYSGRIHDYRFSFEVENDIKVLEELKEKIKEPQILSYSGLETVNFYTKASDDNFIGNDTIKWLYEIKCEETDTVNDIRNCILKLSTEDVEWTKERNKDLTGIFYRKITFLPEIQEILINEYDKYLQKLYDIKKQMENDEAKKEKDKNNRYAEWKLIHEYKHIKPSGGEEGKDGYIDADYENKNGMVIRMVSRDVFDVGCFSYPKRLERSNAASFINNFTKDERDLCKWLSEFGKFKNIRM